MTTAPPLTTDQRRAALVEGNRIRAVRSEVKAGLRARSAATGAALAADLIRETPADLRSMRVRDLLRVVPTLGTAKVARILLRTDVSPLKMLGGLTPRQREALRAELEGVA